MHLVALSENENYQSLKSVRYYARSETLASQHTLHLRGNRLQQVTF